MNGGSFRDLKASGPQDSVRASVRVHSNGVTGGSGPFPGVGNGNGAAGSLNNYSTFNEDAVRICSLCF